MVLQLLGLKERLISPQHTQRQFVTKFYTRSLVLTNFCQLQKLRTTDTILRNTIRLPITGTEQLMAHFTGSLTTVLPNFFPWRNPKNNAASKEKPLAVKRFTGQKVNS